MRWERERSTYPYSLSVLTELLGVGRNQEHQSSWRRPSAPGYHQIWYKPPVSILTSPGASPVASLLPPPRRQARTPTPKKSSALKGSERLAKKSRQRASNPVLQAQNVLMKKLGVSSSNGQPDAAAYSRFQEIFVGTLSLSQCKAMDTLLPEAGPYFLAMLVETEL